MMHKKRGLISITSHYLRNATFLFGDSADFLERFVPDSQGVEKTMICVKEFSELFVEIGPRLDLLGFAQIAEKLFAMVRDSVDTLEDRREDGRSLRMTAFHRRH